MQEEPQVFETLLEGKLTGMKSGLRFDSPEYTQMRLKFLDAKAEKQNMALVSGCLAFAAPLMPLGFLSTFFLLGKLDGMDKGPESLFAGKDDLTAEMAKLAAAEALARKRKKDGVEEPDILKMVDAHNKRSDQFLGGRSVLWAEKRVLPSAKMRKQNEFFVDPGDYKKKAEIRKQKMALEAVKEAECKNQNFSAVSEIASKLELLEKAMNRLFRR